MIRCLKVENERRIRYAKIHVAIEQGRRLSGGCDLMEVVFLFYHTLGGLRNHLRYIFNLLIKRDDWGLCA